MDRAARTVLASLSMVALLLCLGLPGDWRERLKSALLAAVTGMLVLGGGMAAANLLLQNGWLEAATAWGLLTMAAALEVPSRVAALRLGIPVAEARGVAFMALTITSFVAAWVAGPDPTRLAG